MNKSDKVTIRDLIKTEGIDCKGFGIIAKLVTTDVDLSIGAKALYSYLCSYAGSGTTAYPRREKILASLKMSKDAYYKYQKELLTYGYIKAKRGEKYPFPNTYTIVSRPPKLNKITVKVPESGDVVVPRGIKQMGYGTVPKAVMLDDRLHYKAKALYAYFCSFAGNGTTAVPKRDTICYHMQFTINSFQRYIRELIQYNYIEVEQTKKQGRFANNIYYLNDLPDEEIGQKEIERRNEIQKKKAAKSKGQAVEIDTAETEGVNIDTPHENAVEKDILGVENPPQETTSFVVDPVNSEQQQREEAAKIMEERAIYSEVIRDNIEIEIFENKYHDKVKYNNEIDLLNLIVELILDTVTSTAPFIKIKGEKKPTEIVKSKLLKLGHEDIEYVIDSLLKTTTKIKNIQQYILTSLYNGKSVNFYWTNQYNYDSN